MATHTGRRPGAALSRSQRAFSGDSIRPPWKLATYPAGYTLRGTKMAVRAARRSRASGAVVLRYEAVRPAGAVEGRRARSAGDRDGMGDGERVGSDRATVNPSLARSCASGSELRANERRSLPDDVEAVHHDDASLAVHEPSTSPVDAAGYRSRCRHRGRCREQQPEDGECSWSRRRSISLDHPCTPGRRKATPRAVRGSRVEGQR